HLRQYTGTRLDDLLATLELFLPFRQDSHLPARTLDGRPGPATLIEQWTGGILRDIMILIRDACRRAILESRPALELPILEAAWKEIQRSRSPISSRSFGARDQRERRAGSRASPAAGTRDLEAVPLH